MVDGEAVGDAGPARAEPDRPLDDPVGLERLEEAIISGATPGGLADIREAIPDIGRERTGGHRVRIGRPDEEKSALAADEGGLLGTAARDRRPEGRPAVEVVRPPEAGRGDIEGKHVGSASPEQGGPVAGAGTDLDERAESDEGGEGGLGGDRPGEAVGERPAQAGHAVGITDKEGSHARERVGTSGDRHRELDVGCAEHALHLVARTGRRRGKRESEVPVVMRGVAGPGDGIGPTEDDVATRRVDLGDPGGVDGVPPVGGGRSVELLRGERAELGMRGVKGQTAEGPVMDPSRARGNRPDGHAGARGPPTPFGCRPDEVDPASLGLPAVPGKAEGEAMVGVGAGGLMHVDSPCRQVSRVKVWAADGPFGGGSTGRVPVRPTLHMAQADTGREGAGAGEHLAARIRTGPMRPA